MLPLNFGDAKGPLIHQQLEQYMAQLGS